MRLPRKSGSPSDQKVDGSNPAPSSSVLNCFQWGWQHLAQQPTLTDVRIQVQSIYHELEKSHNIIASIFYPVADCDFLFSMRQLYSTSLHNLFPFSTGVSFLQLLRMQIENMREQLRKDAYWRQTLHIKHCGVKT